MIGRIRTLAGERTHIGPHNVHIHIRKPFYFAKRWFNWDDPSWVGIGIAVEKIEAAEQLGRKLKISWYTRTPTYTITPFRFRKLAGEWGGPYRVRKTRLLVVPSGKLQGYRDRVWEPLVEEVAIPDSVMGKLRGSPGYKKVMAGRGLC